MRLMPVSSLHAVVTSWNGSHTLGMLRLTLAAPRAPGSSAGLAPLALQAVATEQTPMKGMPRHSLPRSSAAAPCGYVKLLQLAMVGAVTHASCAPGALLPASFCAAAALPPPLPLMVAAAPMCWWCCAVTASTACATAMSTRAVTTHRRMLHSFCCLISADGPSRCAGGEPTPPSPPSGLVAAAAGAEFGAADARHTSQLLSVPSRMLTD
jgi:hypothetical protein